MNSHQEWDPSDAPLERTHCPEQQQSGSDSTGVQIGRRRVFSGLSWGTQRRVSVSLPSSYCSTELFTRVNSKCCWFMYTCGWKAGRSAALVIAGPSSTCRERENTDLYWEKGGGGSTTQEAQCTCLIPSSTMPVLAEMNLRLLLHYSRNIAGILCINWRCLQQFSVAGTCREGNWVWEKQQH